MSAKSWPRGPTLEPWSDQQSRLPGQGRHIVAGFDADTVIVYQAYRPEIGRWAAENGHLGGPHFSLERFSWIKTSFLWMMHRSDWGRKEGQTVVLAVRLRRAGFEALLGAAVPAKADLWPHLDAPTWRQALSEAQVQLNWDPDYDPMDVRLPRRAIQLGLRGAMLRRFALEWTVDVQDISPFVAQAVAQRQEPRLLLPRQDVYPIHDPGLASRLVLDVEGAEVG